jgi:two-component sensor histidine kinase
VEELFVTTLALSALAPLVIFVLRPAFTPRALLFTAGFFAIGVVGISLLRRLSLRTVAAIVVVLVWVVLFAVLFTGGGVRAPAYAVILIVDFIAVLVFGLRGGLLVMAVGFVGGGILVFQELNGLLPEIPGSHSAYYVWVVNSVVQGLAVLLVLTATGRMKNALRRQEEELTVRRAAEQALRVSEERLRSSLDEKVVLLKEVHHRVKNNMQVINSLIALQEDRIEDPNVLELFRTTRSRIKSMALIHDALYREGNLARISFGPYVRGLVSELVHVYSVGNVATRIETGEFSLGIDQAIPAGLIVNELVSNALKHGLTTGGEAELRIGLKCADGEVSVAVRDNGPGLPPGLEYASTSALGMHLIQMLTDQLEGTLRIGPGPGGSFELRFPHA